MFVRQGVLSIRLQEMGSGSSRQPPNASEPCVLARSLHRNVSGASSQVGLALVDKRGWHSPGMDFINPFAAPHWNWNDAVIAAHTCVRRDVSINSFAQRSAVVGPVFRRYREFTPVPLVTAFACIVKICLLRQDSRAIETARKWLAVEWRYPCRDVNGAAFRHRCALLVFRPAAFRSSDWIVQTVTDPPIECNASTMYEVHASNDHGQCKVGYFMGAADSLLRMTANQLMVAIRSS